MTGAEFTAAAAQIERALRDAGLVVERAEMQGGNVRWWVPITAEEILGRWMQNGWRVRQVPAQPAPDQPVRVLQLLPTHDADDDGA